MSSAAVVREVTERPILLTARQLEILQHALGVDEYGRSPKGANLSYDGFCRNFFCAGGKDEDICRELVEMGYMRQRATTEVYPYFNCSVTDAGQKAMREESPKPPKLTPGQKRYKEWLEVADCFPDWSFGDWLKHRREVAQ
jgi:hypothetical protein